MESPLKAEVGEYQPISFYEEFVEWYGAFAPYIALSTCASGEGVSQTITRNFVCRAAVSLRGVIALYKVEDYQDCWVAYRCLLDRLFHLHYLNRTGKFADFDDWSFLQQYDARNAIRSSEDFKDRIDARFFRDTEEARKRAKALREHQLAFRRPFPEDEAKKMDVRFLYTQGYDYASTLVHPMANDGQQDYTTVTGFGGPWPEQMGAVNNSCLASLLIVQEAMRGSKLKWLGIVQQCLHEALAALGTGSQDYLRTFLELCKVAPGGEWCVREEENATGGDPA